MSLPAHKRLTDGRLHLQHGPIDCIVQAWGADAEVESAYAQAIAGFADVLETLVGELAVLRSPVTGESLPQVRGPVARRMVGAVWPYRAGFITPMAAVAGAVAEEVLDALLRGRVLNKAYVNDGGDIALYLPSPAVFDVGIALGPDAPRLAGTLRIASADRARGIATSGWRGRSQSLGIADSVTVLARTAAEADAAATVIANAVDVDHPAIRRRPAREVKEDSDLGDLPVTTEVGALPAAAFDAALAAGERTAHALLARNLILGATLLLGGQWRIVQETPMPPLSPFFGRLP